MSGAPSILLRGGRVLDPVSGRDGTADVRIGEGRIVAIGEDLEPGRDEEVIDLEGRLVTAGLVDVHVHLREPGGERAETITTGAAAAAAGGFTTVCAMPNTDPVVDTPDLVRYVAERGVEAGAARVRPIAAATRGSAGEEPTDVAALVGAGAVAVSDDGLPIPDALLPEVLRRAAEASVPVAAHCEVCALSAGGAVFAGHVAEDLGVAGIPPEAESEAVERSIDAVRRGGGRLHVCHVSTARSVALVRAARDEGLAVTAEATPHHLLLTTRVVLEHGSAAKMNPPLAREADREAVREAVVDGAIGCVATDHAPHPEDEKARGLAGAPFGIVGLETAFPVVYTDLVESGEMPLEVLVERMTSGPADAFGLIEAGRLREGGPADVAVFDLGATREVDPARFRSKSRNTPWAGRRLQGWAVLTIVGGRIVHDALTGGAP